MGRVAGKEKTQFGIWKRYDIMISSYHDERFAEDILAQILIRNVENDIKERLRQRATRHGHSMEAEARDILRAALKTVESAPSGLGTRIASRFRHIGLRKGEEIPALRGHAIKSPFEK
jgi:plasmid stability protein